MAKKQKEICPICKKKKTNVEKHKKLAHPDYQEPTQAADVQPATTPEPPPPATENPPEVPQAVEEPTPVSEVAKPVPEEKPLPKPEEEKTSRSYVKIVLAIPVLLIGLFLLYIGKDNPITILLGAAIAAGSFFLARSGWKQGEIRVISGPSDGTEKSKYPPNALVIRCKDAIHATNHFGYEYVEKPLGQRKKRRNDNKWFYVMRETSPTDKTLIEHNLPDNSDSQTYCEPSVMANALSLPATKRLFEYSPDNLQKISLIIMLGIVIAEIIGLIALSGSGAEPETASRIVEGVAYAIR